MPEHFLEPNKDVKLDESERFPEPAHSAYGYLAQGIHSPAIPSTAQGFRNKHDQGTSVREAFQSLTLAPGETITHAAVYAYVVVPSAAPLSPRAYLRGAGTPVESGAKAEAPYEGWLVRNLSVVPTLAQINALNFIGETGGTTGPGATVQVSFCAMYVAVTTSLPPVPGGPAGWQPGKARDLIRPPIRHVAATPALEPVATYSLRRALLGYLLVVAMLALAFVLGIIAADAGTARAIARIGSPRAG
jgi:hypothetical protein